MRQSGQAEKSVELFRKYPQKIKNDRVFCFEWGMSEGLANSRCTNICLAALSLADNLGLKWPTVEDASKGFAGMGKTFGRLYDIYNDKIFIEACGATLQLGMLVKRDEKGSEYFKEVEEKSLSEGVEKVSIQQALIRFKNGVAAAWERKEVNLSDYSVPDVRELKYGKLYKLLNIEQESFNKKQ